VKPWYLYIVKCKDGTLYTGITTDIRQRIIVHNSGRGAKYTRGRGPVKLVHCRGGYRDRSQASKAEYKFKTLKRDKKLQIIDKFAIPGELVMLKRRPNMKNNLYYLVVGVSVSGIMRYSVSDSLIYYFSDGTSNEYYKYTKIQI
jgi:putative endonuclease